MKSLVQEVSEILNTEMVHSKIVLGNKEEVLKNFINENFIDLIIVGSPDLEKKSEFLDHKNILINTIDTPLLVIPEFKIFEPLLSFNFLTSNSEKDIEDIILLSKLFVASNIVLTHFANGKASLKTRQNNWKSFVNDKVPGRIEHNTINEDIGTYISQENLGLENVSQAFVFTTKKRNFWSRIIDPSTTLGYLAGLEIPSIIFKTSA